MVRPLYRILDEDAPRRVQQGHAGLWFDKFCDKWQVRSQWEMGQNKLKWIVELTKEKVGGSCRENAHRLMRLAQAAGGCAQIFTTESRFVTGLGRSHPVENGFAWHPTMGTPFLPGSSVKGMIRAWAEAEQVPPSAYEGLLGSAGSVGRVIFLDAIPTEPVSLEADVMTPHFGGWDESNPPGDWRSPKPIPFLVAAVGTPFLFCLVPTPTTKDDELAVASRWLHDALAWAGAGAKTAVGYGRMTRDEEREGDLRNELKEREVGVRRQREKEGRLAAMSPLEREIDQILTNRDDKGVPSSTVIFKEIKRGRWQGDDKKAAAMRLETMMKEEKKWRPKSQKKRPEKDTAHWRTLRIQEWLNE